METIMILGASLLQLPAILKAKEMGLHVIAVDRDKEAVGFSYADTSLLISTTDIPNVLRAARQYKINGIMTLASDMPMRTVAAVTEEFHLPGIKKQTALAATNKAVMRQKLRENQVPIPRYYKVSDYAEYLNALAQFSKVCIVKPTDNSGSRGVFLLNTFNNPHEVKKVYEYSRQYSTSGDLMIEEYMEGPEVSVESICYNGKVNIVAITDKLTTGVPKFVEMGHSEPSRLSMTIQEKIKSVTVKAIHAIGIDIGPSHTEIIVTREGPKIVELGARLGGDNITTHLVPYSTGIDMVKSCIELSLGYPFSMEKMILKGSAIRYFKSQEGRIKEITGVKEASQIAGLKQISLIKHSGDIIHNIENSADRIGFVIAQSETVENAVTICEEAIKRIRIIMEPDE